MNSPFPETAMANWTFSKTAAMNESFQLPIEVEVGAQLLAQIPLTPAWANIVAFCGILMFALPSTVGNVIVGSTILYKKELRNEPTYMAMTVLAAMDLPHTFVAIYPMGGSILVQHNVPSYATRLIPLNVIYPAWYCTCIAYMTIAVNRWLAVCYPDLNKLIFSKRNMLIWMSTWPAISVLLMVPMLVGKCCPVDFTPSLWLLRYEEGRESELNIQLIVCYVASATTTAVSCIAYPLAFLKIRQMQKLCSNKNLSNRSSKSSYNDGCQRSKKRSSSRMARVKSHDVRLLIQFMMLTGVFTFTWITLHFEASLGPARANGILCYLGMVGYAAMTGVNSLIYLTMNKTLRRGASELWTALRKGQKAAALKRRHSSDFFNDSGTAGVNNNNNRSQMRRTTGVGLSGTFTSSVMPAATSNELIPLSGNMVVD